MRISFELSDETSNIKITMKTTIKIFAMALFAVLFTSCCKLGKQGSATGQSGTGEPPIGLIPTMKTLAP
jgi:hypothetical protein